ncbi:response regulator transcription factor [Psychrobacter frigidicola]|uniref:response regulator transcription factor n=1 Tax=Psychrobacter frigidicola TaxID=45611 RepID=UPI001917B831|nr:response regulator transcription factor [Psychrobacter frigidicola]
MPNILLGDDDEELTQLLQEYLHNHGISCDCVHDGEAVMQRLKQDAVSHDGSAYDLLVLDIMMPKMDGLSVLRQLPAVSDIPVIMLTAKGDEIDRIIGLELGADDYITKPCNPRELLARINAVIKRTSAASSEHTPLPDSRLHLEQTQRICQIDNVELRVTGTEFDLLVALLRQKGEVVSKAWLSQHVLQRELQPFDRSLDVHVSRLRKKLQPFHDEPIKAIRGKGYQLVL